MKVFRELILAFVKDMVRDRMTIFWFLAFPILFILLFGAIFSGDWEQSNFNIGLVISEDSSAVHIEQAFTSVPAFTVSKGNKVEELEAMRRGERDLVVFVPELNLDGESTEVLVYYDPRGMETVQVLLSSVRQVFNGIERAITGSPELFKIQTLTADIDELRNIDYLLPGILAMAIMQLGLFGSLQFVDFREKKVLRRLGTTPLSKNLVLWSEITVRLAMAVLQTILILTVGYLVYNVSVTGNPLLIVLFVLLGASLFISLGFFLTSFSKSVDSAMGIVQVVQFPMMFLSGIFFPLEFMPSFLQPIMRAIPLSYLGDMLRHVIIGIPSEFGFWTNFGVIMGWWIAASLLAIKFFRWE